MEQVLFDVDDRIATITNNNPEKHNEATSFGTEDHAFSFWASDRRCT